MRLYYLSTNAKRLMIKRVNNPVERWTIVVRTRRNYRIFLGGSKWRAKIAISRGQTAATAAYMFNECTGKISRVNQNTSRLLLSAMASSLSRFLYLSHLKTLLATLLVPLVSHTSYTSRWLTRRPVFLERNNPIDETKQLELSCPSIGSTNSRTNLFPLSVILARWTIPTKVNKIVDLLNRNEIVHSFFPS